MSMKKLLFTLIFAIPSIVNAELSKVDEFVYCTAHLEKYEKERAQLEKAIKDNNLEIEIHNSEREDLADQERDLRRMERDGFDTEYIGRRFLRNVERYNERGRGLNMRSRNLERKIKRLEKTGSRVYSECSQYDNMNIVLEFCDGGTYASERTEKGCYYLNHKFFKC